MYKIIWNVQCCIVLMFVKKDFSLCFYLNFTVRILFLLFSKGLSSLFSCCFRKATESLPTREKLAKAAHLTGISLNSSSPPFYRETSTIKFPPVLEKWPGRDSMWKMPLLYKRHRSLMLIIILNLFKWVHFRKQWKFWQKGAETSLWKLGLVWTQLCSNKSWN